MFNTNTNYGLISKLFHWVIGAFYIIILTLGFIMVDMPANETKYSVYGMHKAFGVILLGLVILRIVWKLSNINPRSINQSNRILNSIAKIVHFVLYIFMITMPLSGIIMSIFGGRNINIFGLFEIPALQDGNKSLSKLAHTYHINIALFFAILIALHFSSALYHHFYKKDKTLRRMLP
jgi:cytochrome b561